MTAREQIIRSLNLILIAETDLAGELIKEKLGENCIVVNRAADLPYEKVEYVKFLNQIPAGARVIRAEQLCFVVVLWYLAPEEDAIIQKLNRMTCQTKASRQANHFLNVVKSLESIGIHKSSTLKSRLEKQLGFKLQ